MSLGTGSLGSGSLGSGGAGVLAPPPFIPPAPPVVLDVWPVGLPQIPLRDGYAETEPNVITRTDMDEGPAKQRPRFTVGIRPFLVPLEMDVDQVAIFQTFYENTLRDGTLPFTWKHPRNQTNIDFYIRGTLKPKPKGARNWIITMVLEVMP